MERFRYASILIFFGMAMSFCRAFWSGDGVRDDSVVTQGPELFDCVAGGDNAGGEALCVVEMNMLAAFPERYCEKKIWLFGYLDSKSYRFFTSKETADRGLYPFSVKIEDERAVLAIDNYRRTNERPVFASVTAKFECNEKSEREGIASFGSLSVVREISEVVGIDLGKGIYSATY